MPQYSFACDCGNSLDTVRSIKTGPPQHLKCALCGRLMQRIYRVAPNVPKVTRNPWDVMYETIIEPGWQKSMEKYERSGQRKRDDQYRLNQTEKRKNEKENQKRTVLGA